MFSNVSKREVIILTTSNLSFANAFNLDQSEILSFGKELKLGFCAKELTHSLIHHFEVFANFKEATDDNLNVAIKGF